MAKTKPVAAARFSEYGRIPLAEVRSHRDYDGSTDTILVPKSIADRIVFADSVADLKRTVGAALVPAVVRLIGWMDRVFGRVRARFVWLNRL